MKTKLIFATSCKYLGGVICNDISDEEDIQAKFRLLYAKCNMLRHPFHVGFFLIISYLLPTSVHFHMYTLWVNYRKAAFNNFLAVCSNFYSILHRLRRSVKHVFAVYNVNSRKCLIRMVIYCSMIRFGQSLNPIIQNIAINNTYYLRRNCGVRGY